MENSKLIAVFEIPQYLREIEVSAKQRPKYYTWDGTTIKAKNKKLLQKYINPLHKEHIISNNGNISPSNLKYPYVLVKVKANKVIGIFGNKSSLTGKFFNSEICYLLDTKLTLKEEKKPTKYILINYETHKKVLANETQAGKPKKIIIKGQDMYSGVLNEFTRAKIVNELKTDYDKKVDYFPILTKSDYPVMVIMEVVDTIKDYYDNTKEGDGKEWDVDNRAYIYRKTFVDFLVKSEVITKDDRLHVKGGGEFFTPCERFEDRKLIFRIYKNDN